MINHFISRVANRCTPFFETLKNASKFAWDNKCNKAFEELKQFLVIAPVLASPKVGEELCLHIAIFVKAVRAVFIRKKDKCDQPIFYTSKTLVEAETRYLMFGKMSFILVCAAMKLRPYFKAHTIDFFTNIPIKNAHRLMSVV
ncbi:hypothetical protein LINPERPRIM_LOCUS22270 [Linum perenne]